MKTIEIAFERVEIKAQPRKLKGKWKFEMLPTVYYHFDDVISSKVNKWGFRVHMRWRKGFRNHCILMLDDIDLFCPWMTSGNATVALEKEDL